MRSIEISRNMCLLCFVVTELNTVRKLLGVNEFMNMLGKNGRSKVAFPAFCFICKCASYLRSQ